MNPSNKGLKTIFWIAVPALAVGAVLVDGSVIDLNGRAESSVPERLDVSYTDLDVNTSDGVAVLLHRIRVAAAEVCSSDTRDLAHKALRQSCIDRAIVETVAQINNPLLSDRYLANMTADAPVELVAVRQAE